MERLEARRLRYAPGGRIVIDALDLSLASGELVALIGPNGAGKSTLLRMLTGFLPPDRGECRLGGRSLAEWPRAAGAAACGDAAAESARLCTARRRRGGDGARALASRRYGGHR